MIGSHLNILLHLRPNESDWALMTSSTEAWFQVSYLSGLRDMLSPYFEVTTPGSTISYNEDVMANRARYGLMCLLMDTSGTDTAAWLFLVFFDEVSVHLFIATF